ncbi:MAG TPA: YjjG family noncanonical pyrimidine nucleotidase [Lachnospiraceae bacterium]|nr:YjjG family noncanonical pyrimidine nucleotidase [Lachnospiraceae bacterium]
MKYDIIIFDADETLFDFDYSEKVAFRNTMLDYGFDYEENYHLKLYLEINNKLWKELENGLTTLEKLKTERFDRFIKRLGANIDSYELAEAYENHLADCSILFEGSIPLIESLCNNYKLFIVTNGITRVQEKRIRRSEIAKYFDGITISEEVSVAKPDPKIFDYALSNCDFDKKRVLMVGDSLTSDIQGGINYGIDTCWLNTKGKVNHGKIKPTYEIKNIMDLSKILSRS